MSEKSRDLLDWLLKTAVLCNEADLHMRDGQWIWRGDPTDVALLSLGHKAGIVRAHLLEKYPPSNEIPFEPEHQFAATFHGNDGKTFVFVKGSPEKVLSMCGFAAPGSRARLLAQAESIARTGNRVHSPGQNSTMSFRPTKHLPSQ